MRERTRRGERPMVGRLRESDLLRPAREFVEPVGTRILADQDAASALESLRARWSEEKIMYFYAVDADGTLAGVVPARKLMFAPPGQAVRELMTPAVSIPADATLRDALETLAEHKLLALPVVDADKRLIGAVEVGLYTNDSLDIAGQRRFDDLFQMIGLSVQAMKRTSARRAFGLRMPWLAGNIVSGLACAMIAAAFAAALRQVLVLAMFIPLVLTLSESVSMQSMSLTLQFLHSRRMPVGQLRRRAANEWRTSLLLGVACGLVACLLSTFWGGGLGAAAVLGISIAVSMVLAATLGVVIPVALYARRLDPRLAAGPVILMASDVLTTTVYLGLGMLLL